MDNISSAYAEVPAMAQMVGYEMKTTFWGDFSVAERVSGIDGVKDTFKRAFEEYKDDRIYGTELCMVLNWKIWQYFESDTKLARVYDDLWKELDGYICSHWKGKDLDYFLATTD